MSAPSVAPPTGRAGRDGALGRAARRRSRLLLGLQLGPASAFVVVFLIVPFAILFLYSFWRLKSYEVVAEWNLDSYRRVFQEAAYRQLLLNTLKIAMGASVLATVIAFAFAHALRFRLSRWQEPLLFCVVVALFSGYLVRIYAWRTILGERGVINESLTRIGLIDQPLSFLVFNRGAAIVVLANFLVPIAILPIYGAMQNIRDREIEAARDLGCGSWATFRRVTLPLAWPGVFFAWALTFLTATGDYLVPQLIGGANGTMLGVIITDTLNADFNLPRGSALAFTALVVTLSIIALVRWLGGKVLR